VTGDCDAGHWCQSGVDRADPDNPADNSTYNATCGLGGHTGKSVIFISVYLFIEIYVSVIGWLKNKRDHLDEPEDLALIQRMFWKLQNFAAYCYPCEK